MNRIHFTGVDILSNSFFISGCSKYNIMSIPTMLLIDNDEVVERINGVISLDDLNNKIKVHL